jgi:hypothetical protein
LESLGGEGLLPLQLNAALVELVVVAQLKEGRLTVLVRELDLGRRCKLPHTPKEVALLVCRRVLPREFVVQELLETPINESPAAVEALERRTSAAVKATSM